MSALLRHGLALAISTWVTQAATEVGSVPNSERASGAPMPPQEVVQRSELPPGFHLSVFAAEPDVRQPIAMATDPRGRLWVAENYTYSEQSINYHPGLRDQIVILEDLNNDGRFDRRTVFWDQAERLTSIEIGNGGVWAICLPQLIFLPDANGDDVPDGPPQVILDGFEFERARHTVANGLRWGPDGWLYGRQGILGLSKIGPPGAPDAERKNLNVGIWRYHPGRRTFQVVADGTTNPWGMDWDARGEAFFINTVIGHLWHFIPGAHYRRMFGDDPDPHVYELIEQHADHVHWASNEVWTDVRKGVTDATLAAGGGHAHTGLLIYQGGQWPAEWNGRLLTINFHGRLLNAERLEPQGSGYVGRREPDAFRFADPWFRGIDLLAAPDGGIFVSDWSDTGECHDHDGIHRSSGRIYKLTYGEAKSDINFDLTGRPSLELISLQTNSNDWLARQARRVLIERHLRDVPLEKAREALAQLARRGETEVIRLRALWTLHSIGGVGLSLLREKLEGSAPERAWALRLLEDERHDDPSVEEFFSSWCNSGLAEFGSNESSASVRLALASLLQNIPNLARASLARALLKHSEDDQDHNLPLMIWYGIKDLMPNDPESPRWIAEGKIPRVQRLAARRFAEALDVVPRRVDSLLETMSETLSVESQAAILDGLADGFAGLRKVAPPPSWARLAPRLMQSGNEHIRTRARDLSALFGDGRALEEIRAVALNDSADLARRRAALSALIEVRDRDLRRICEHTLPIRDLSAVSARGLALYSDSRIADRLLAEWPRLYGHERPGVMNALLSRSEWAAKLLDAIATGKVARADLGVPQARQILRFGNEALIRRLTEAWGVLNDSLVDQNRTVFQPWRERLTADALKKADAAVGSRLFANLCGSCHRLYGVGGTLAMDLTGSGRQNLEYLLENILFPNAVVPADYRQTTLLLKDGRTLSGVVRRRDSKVLLLEGIGETFTIGRSEIEEEQTSELSMMPEGLLDSLNDTQAVDLFAYLMSSSPPRGANGNE